MNEFYHVNGKKKNFSKGKEIYISDLVNEIFGNNNKKQLAIALNFKLVCKSKWRKTKIKQNDKIEIVSAFTGG